MVAQSDAHQKNKHLLSAKLPWRIHCLPFRKSFEVCGYNSFNGTMKDCVHSLILALNGLSPVSTSLVSVFGAQCVVDIMWLKTSGPFACWSTAALRNFVAGWRANQYCCACAMPGSSQTSKRNRVWYRVKLWQWTFVESWRKRESIGSKSST